MTAFIERWPPAEPPAELLTRILHEAAEAGASERAERNHRGGGTCSAAGCTAVLQPRYVMGMAMTMLSFSMIANFAHIEPRQLRPCGPGSGEDLGRH